MDFLFGAEFSLQNIAPSLPFDLLINADAGFGVGSETSDEYYFDYWDGELVEIVEGPNEFAVGLIYRFGIEGRFAISDNMVVGLGYKWEHSAWAGGDIKLSPNSLEASIRFR